MPTKPEVELPEGWKRTGNSRPAYRRRDGYVVKLDNPANWGVRAPGENRPFRRGWPDQHQAMAWVDAEYPVEVRRDQAG